jgi:hypothetical protein
MRKLQIIYFIFLFVCGHTYANEDQIARNFALALLNPNDATIALITSDIPTNQKDLSPERLELFTNPKCSKFFEKRYPIDANVCVIASYCKKLAKNIFLKKENVGFSTFEKIEPVNIRQNSVWLVILKSMYDEKGILDPELSHDLNGIEEFEFVNRNTFFRIPASESKNSICLKWDNSDNYPLPNRILTSEMRLTEDIKILSEIFCGNNINLMMAIEKINNEKSNLITLIGKKIAVQLLIMLENEIIKTEFKPNKNSTLDFKKIENKLNKAK